MSTRTLDEVKEAVRIAINHHDPAELSALLEELKTFTSIEAEALAHRVQSAIYELQGNFSGAISSIYESLALWEQLESVIGIATCFGQLGILYKSTGEVAKALEWLHRALAVYEDNGARGHIGGTINNIGMIHHSYGDYAKALEYYFKALEIHVEVGNRFFQANTLGNIGSVYENLHQLPSALSYFQQSLELHREVGNRKGESSGLADIGTIYLAMKNFEEAEKWLRQAIDVAVEAELSLNQASAYRSLATLLAQSGRSGEALSLLDEHNDLLKQHPRMYSDALKYRADILLERGEYSECQQLLLQALEGTTARNARGSIAEIYRSLRDLAKMQGDFEAYFSYNEKFLEVDSEVNGVETIQRVALQEKEREMEAQRITQQRERDERDRERAILYGALPQHVAERLIRGETVTDHYDNASVLFLDIAGFTRISSLVPAGHVVHLLEAIFGACDEIFQRYDIMKIKTIGDSYMAFSEKEDHQQRMASAAMEIQEYLETMQVKMPPELGDTSWTKDVGDIYARIGIHCGPVVAGIVGKDRLQYDIWGDTVNIASRMESSGEPRRIHVSDAFAATLRATGSGVGHGTLTTSEQAWHLELRGETEVKGKGTLTTYWLLHP